MLFHLPPELPLALVPLCKIPKRVYTLLHSSFTPPSLLLLHSSLEMAAQSPPSTSAKAKAKANDLSTPAHTTSFKRLIICCDGTWEAGDHVSKGDSSYQTNITRMCHALADDLLIPDGTRVPQIIYYQSGVGANVPTALGRSIAGLSSHSSFPFSYPYSTPYQVPLATASTKTFSPPTTSL